MTEKIYLETFENFPGSVCFPLLLSLIGFSKKSVLNSKMSTENSLTSNLRPVPIDIDQFFVNCNSPFAHLVFICPLSTSPLPICYQLFKIEKRKEKNIKEKTK